MILTLEASWPSLSVQLVDRWTNTVEVAPHPPDLDHPASFSDETGHLGPVTSNMINSIIYLLFLMPIWMAKSILYKLLNCFFFFYKCYNDLHLKCINLHDMLLNNKRLIICHLFSTNTYQKRNCSLRIFSKQCLYMYMYKFGSFPIHSISFYEEWKIIFS